MIDETVKRAEKYDTALAFTGLTDYVESEGCDRENMRLPENQLALMGALIKTGKKVVAVLYGGSPVELPFADKTAAILNMYLPGQRGGVCMLDKYSGMAFCGDTINPWDVWLGLDESLSVTEYRKSLVLLLQAVGKNGITKLHSGHSGKAMNAQKIKTFITLYDKIIGGEKTDRKVDKGICKGYKARYKTAALIRRKR